MMKGRYMMDIHLRRIDASAIKIIDEKAKTNRMTRNELLKQYIEEMSQFDGVKQERKSLDATLNRVADALEMTFKRLENLEDRNIRLYLLLCDSLGFDPKAADLLLNKEYGLSNKEVI